jgi:hypothetical protein
MTEPVSRLRGSPFFSHRKGRSMPRKHEPTPPEFADAGAELWAETTAG